MSEMYELSIGAVGEHENGIVKKLAKIIDERKSDAAESDSIWCQSMVLVSAIKERIDKKSAMASFLEIAKRVVKLMKKFAKHPFLKKIVEIVELVIRFIDKQRKLWLSKVNLLQNNRGYKKGKIFFIFQ